MRSGKRPGGPLARNAGPPAPGPRWTCPHTWCRPPDRARPALARATPTDQRAFQPNASSRASTCGSREPLARVRAPETRTNGTRQRWRPRRHTPRLRANARSSRRRTRPAMRPWMPSAAWQPPTCVVWRGGMLRREGICRPSADPFHLSHILDTGHRGRVTDGRWPEPKIAGSDQVPRSSRPNSAQTLR